MNGQSLTVDLAEVDWEATVRALKILGMEIPDGSTDLRSQRERWMLGRSGSAEFEIAMGIWFGYTCFTDSIDSYLKKILPKN